jgi:hypothetical protein
VAAKKASGEAADTLEVIDVAQLLIRTRTPVAAAPDTDGDGPAAAKN